MAIYEQTGRMTYVDKIGDRHVLYPITKKECVDGLLNIEQSIGDINNLETNDKSSIVSAINEAARSVGSITNEQIFDAVSDWMEQNPFDFSEIEGYVQRAEDAATRAEEAATRAEEAADRAERLITGPNKFYSDSITESANVPYFTRDMLSPSTGCVEIGDWVIYGGDAYVVTAVSGNIINVDINSPLDPDSTLAGQVEKAEAAALRAEEAALRSENAAGNTGGGVPDGVSVFYTSEEPEQPNFPFDPFLVAPDGKTIEAGDWLVTPSGKVYVVDFIDSEGVTATYDETLRVESGVYATLNIDKEFTREPETLGGKDICAASELLYYDYGTEDLVPGVSPLETGKLYFVFEVI